MARNALATQPRQSTKGWLFPAVAILALAMAFAAGAAIAMALQSEAPTATPARTLTGRITIVDEDGTAFCIVGADEEAQYCSEAYLPPGAPSLQVGDRITGTVAIVRIGDVTQEVFIVTDRGETVRGEGA